MDTHFRERERSVPLWMTVDPAMRRRIETAIEGLVALLDQIDGDEDLEDGNDDEPVMGWPDRLTGASVADPVPTYLQRPERDPDGECEIDADHEPALCPAVTNDAGLLL